MPSHSASPSSQIDWPRVTWIATTIARLLAALIAACAGGILSFGSLRSLGSACGYGSGVTWMLPVAVDVLALASWLAWRQGLRERFATLCGLGAMVVSMVGNALSHVIAAGYVHPHWWLVSAVGSVPPAAVPLVLKLTAPLRRTVPAEHHARVRETCNVAGDWPMWEQEAAAHGADVAPSTTPEPVTVLALTAETQDATDARYADAWNVPLDLIERCRAAGVISVRGIRTTFSRTEDEARRANKALRHVDPAQARAKATAPIRQAVSA